MTILANIIGGAALAALFYSTPWAYLLAGKRRRSGEKISAWNIHTEEKNELGRIRKYSYIAV